MYKFLRPIFKYSFLTGFIIFIPFTITTSIREFAIMKRLHAPKTKFIKVFWFHVVNNSVNMVKDLYWSESGKWTRKKLLRVKTAYVRIRDRKLLAEAKEKQSKLSVHE